MNFRKLLFSIALLLLIPICIVLGLDVNQPVHGQQSDFQTPSSVITPTVNLPAIFYAYDVHVPPIGLISSSIFDLPGDQTLSCEHSYTTRLTMDNLARGIHPQSMHFSSCNIDSETPTMFASFTLAQAEPDDPDEFINNQSGMITQTIFNSETNQLDVVGTRHFPECSEMIGIDTSNSCGVIAALCRTNNGRTDFNKDIIATHPNPDNWLQDDGKDEMWLYEWTNGDIQSTPAKYIVHKGIGGWEYGQHSIVFGENDNTYGIALKSTRGGHEADSFTVVDRDSYTFDTDRGWEWSCGSGHTIHNRPSYNPVTQQYGLLCGTDYNNQDAGRYGSISFTTESEEKPNFLLLQRDRTQMKGGPGALHPLPDGGWVGIVVGATGDLSYVFDPDANKGLVPAMPPTEVGLARFNQNGDLIGEINWIVSASPHYVSYPQLVPLENGNYLLGYGVMPADGTWVDYHFNLRWTLFFPQEYWLQEIDLNGQPQSQSWRMQDVAWGELDELVYLGNNRVGWATYYMDRLTGSPEDARWYQPHCNAEAIQFNVYSSP